ncbi:MAG: ATP-dependent Clp protease adaptor ClpS [Pirellulales bacterium]|nr:ATP-dependent Clp protease adaptor ClpS [Pirellulales bacterium]
MSDKSATATAEAPVEAPPKTERKPRDKKRPRRQPRYHVVLWDDDEHTHAYVMIMLRRLFGFPLEQGLKLAAEVDTKGQAIVLTTTREHAELKRDQIHAFGKDDLVGECVGSMWSTIEPETTA